MGQEKYIGCQKGQEYRHSEDCETRSRERETGPLSTQRPMTRRKSNSVRLETCNHYIQSFISLKLDEINIDAEIIFMLRLNQ